jgi:hypothetical protein
MIFRRIIRPTIIGILCIISLLSCGKNSYLALETKEMDFVNKSDSFLEGEKLNISVIAPDDILVCDSLLLVLSSDPNSQLKVFSLSSMKQIANLCSKGRAKNEFTRPGFVSNNYQIIDGDIHIQIYDNDYTFKDVNISESIRKQSTIVTKAYECHYPLNTKMIFIDNQINKRFLCRIASMSHDSENISNPPRYTIEIDGNETNELNVFPRIRESVNPEDATYGYFGALHKHPNKNLVVKTFESMDYLLFFDLDNNKNWAIHQIGSTSFDDVVLPTSIDDIDYTHFLGFACTSDIIMTTYIAGAYSVNVSDYFAESKPELLFFDWDGNYLGGVKLNQRTTRFSYDSIHQRIIGIDYSNEVLYSYDISSIMSAFSK